MGDRGRLQSVLFTCRSTREASVGTRIPRLHLQGLPALRQDTSLCPARPEADGGGEHVKCVQQYIEETLVVFDVDSGEKFYERSIFLPSGCAAMRETRKH